MRFVDFVCFEAVVHDLQANDRDGAITELVSSLGKAGKLGKQKCEVITAEVINRENEASTGLGKGVAMPHAKYKSIKKVIATVGLSKVGIDFFALDKQPVYSIFLLISPLDNPDKHLEAMESVFKHLQQEKFRKFLRQCNSAEQVEDLLREVDEDPFYQ